MTLSNISEGLVISLWGVGITFIALGLLILIIFILRWLWPPEINPFKPEESEEKRREIAAAIAVAVSLLERGDRISADLGHVLEGPRGRWWRSKVEKSN
jgi:Na+-transporting methylmalonyl-CoA/oxaloacetate decarboxylase gamma subunit